MFGSSFPAIRSAARGASSFEDISVLSPSPLQGGSGEMSWRDAQERVPCLRTATCPLQQLPVADCCRHRPSLCLPSLLLDWQHSVPILVSSLFCTRRCVVRGQCLAHQATRSCTEYADTNVRQPTLGLVLHLYPEYCPVSPALLTSG